MKVELSGFKGLEEALVELEQITGKTTAGKAALRRAATKAMKPMREKMAQLAPFDPEDRDGDGNHLRDTMKTERPKAKRKRGSFKFERETGVEVLTGPAPVGGRARAAAASNEWGTGPRYTKKGRHTGSLPARPYVRPAADSTSNTVIKTLAELLKVEVDKTVQRAIKKASKGK